MLREVPQARIERHLTLLGRRFALHVDRDGAAAVWGARAFRRLDTERHQHPVAVLDDGPRRWWWFEDRFWREDDGLHADDVLALVRDRERRQRRRVQHAHANLAGERAQATITATPEPLNPRSGGVSPTRLPIPVEVRRAVWERDGARCGRCGATFELQFDHVIPVALGGANTVDNLQVLCGPCNRDKGATLG